MSELRRRWWLAETLWQQVEDAALHENLKEFEYGG